jgi:hypothetical protein
VDKNLQFIVFASGQCKLYGRSWVLVLRKTNGQAAGVTQPSPRPNYKVAFFSYDILQKDVEWVLCCRAQDQSTSGHNKANYILLEKTTLGETNETVSVETQRRAPRPNYKVDMSFLIHKLIKDRIDFMLPGSISVYFWS